MGFLSNLKNDLTSAKRNKAAQINGKNLKGILNVWISEGKEIDEEKFWIEVDYNRQFDNSVEFYERGQ